MDCKEILSWPDEDDYLQEGSGNDVVHCLWDELNQSEDSLLCMQNEQTPAKESMDFGCHVFDYGEKSFEDCRESSLVKRRRMLLFDSGVSDNANDTDCLPSVTISNVREDLLSNDLSENLSLITGQDHDFTEPLVDWWTQGCLNEIDLQYNCDEMISFGSDDLIDMSEFDNMSAEVEVPKSSQVAPPPPRIKFKGGKLSINAPTTPSSVAYPFEIFKPSVVQGDVTLNDINHRIHFPPPCKLPSIKQKISTLHFPTSAISGKPVVAKTKIRTEGGRGSITITRTKG